MGPAMTSNLIGGGNSFDAFAGLDFVNAGNVNTNASVSSGATSNSSSGVGDLLDF